MVGPLGRRRRCVCSFTPAASGHTIRVVTVSAMALMALVAAFLACVAPRFSYGIQGWRGLLMGVAESSPAPYGRINVTSVPVALGRHFGRPPIQMVIDRAAEAQRCGLFGDVAQICRWVASKGYPFEDHNAATADGRLLQLFRLPRPGAAVVHLQHGILDSAWAWVFNEEFKALAFQLHDGGYDVWLGNNRGTGFSEAWADGTSASLSPAFWNFTFDEMGCYDVLAVVREVLLMTGQQRLAWIGHSQGTMQFLVASADPSIQQELAESVSVFVALSPVAFLGHSTSLLRALAAPKLLDILRPIFPLGFLRPFGIRGAVHLLCKLTLGIVCDVSIQLVCGSGMMDDRQNVGRFSKYFPFGTSFKDMEHFAQLMSTGAFQRYDYGAAGNQVAYGQASPTSYNLSAISVPTALLLAEDDAFSPAQDADHLLGALPKEKLVWVEKYPGFSHITWTLGGKSAGYYVGDVLRILQRHHIARM